MASESEVLRVLMGCRMRGQRPVTSTMKWGGAGAVVAACVYAGHAAAAWCRYGKTPAPAPDGADQMLDRFMPIYDVVERHHVRVNAPAEETLSAARQMDLMGSPVARAIFKARALVLGAKADGRARPRGILDLTLSLGWVVLGEVPGREVIVGAVTKPWEADVTFRSVPPSLFAAFAEPGYVKIVWTLRANPIDARTSVFRTETRAIATDDEARRRFRLYWSLASPGISLIRRLALVPLKAEAEQRARQCSSRSGTGGRCADDPADVSTLDSNSRARWAGGWTTSGPGDEECDAREVGSRTAHS